MIESARILSPQFNDAVLYFTGAQVELLRNVAGYLRRLETYTAEYHLGYYLTPTAEDYDQLLAIVANLEEKLMGNPNTIWGYAERVEKLFSATKSGDGTHERWSDTVPEGEVWKLELCTLGNTTGARGRITLNLLSASGTIILDSVADPGTDAVVWVGSLTMQADELLHVKQEACLNGDVLIGGMVAYVMHLSE